MLRIVCVSVVATFVRGFDRVALFTADFDFNYVYFWLLDDFVFYAFVCVVDQASRVFAAY